MIFAKIKNYCIVAIFFWGFNSISVYGFPANAKHEFKLSKNETQCALLETASSKGAQSDDAAIAPDFQQKKVFVGKNRLKYNPSDYYLWVSSYDVNNDLTKDLVAVDWHPRGEDTFYLAFYVWLDKGQLFKERKELKNFLLEQSLEVRHGNGVQPVVPEGFNIIGYNGKFIEESFVSYHVIRPIISEGELHILAEKKVASGVRRLLFGFDKNKKRIELECAF